MILCVTSHRTAERRRVAVGGGAVLILVYAGIIGLSNRAIRGIGAMVSFESRAAVGTLKG